MFIKPRLVALFILIALLSETAVAQSSGGEFVLRKSTIDCGGGTSLSLSFSLTGTIGQADANRQQLVSGGFVLAGGFWAKPSSEIFSDGFESSPIAAKPVSTPLALHWPKFDAMPVLD